MLRRLGYLLDLHSPDSLQWHYDMPETYGHVARLKGGVMGVSHTFPMVLVNQSTLKSRPMRFTLLTRWLYTPYSFESRLGSPNLPSSQGAAILQN